ncbi:MAG TPA: YihY/virulence factor BrkB family protein [Verrucomicrobiales bacterium]|nr:YihY/virulence factor BrkB family protein [Verrucomicrobiales bacterium]
MSILRKAVCKWMDAHILHLSASLAFYTVFSLTPLLVIVLSVAGWAVGDELVSRQVFQQLNDLMGSEASVKIHEMVNSAQNHGRSLPATLVGIGTALFGATSLFMELQHSLNRIWHTPDKPPPEGIIPWLQGRLLSAGMVLVVLFLLLASLLFTGLIGAASGFMSSRLQFSLPVWSVMGFVIAVGGEILLFALIFKVLPHVKLKWKNVWWGALVTTLLFEAGKWVVGWYFSSGLISASYGAAGPIVLLLLWVYYSAIIVLSGALLTQVRADHWDLVPLDTVDLMDTGQGPEPRKAKRKKGKP